MKRNQDKISLWKRKKRWTQQEMRDYIGEQLNNRYPPELVLQQNAFAQHMAGVRVHRNSFP